MIADQLKDCRIQGGVGSKYEDERCWKRKGVECIEGERTDLAGQECTLIQANLAETVGRCAIEDSATMSEVACAVAIACPDRGRRAKIGRLEHRSASIGP
eukprot:IDg22385t1